MFKRSVSIPAVSIKDVIYENLRQKGRGNGKQENEKENKELKITT